jgi:hypothetical protein
MARPEFRPPTRFERRGARLGHGVWDLAYAKMSGRPVKKALAVLAPMLLLRAKINYCAEGLIES